MKKRTTLLMLLVCGLFIAGNAQDTWDLERCVRYAQQNSLSVKVAQTSVKSAQLTEQQSKYDRLPDLSASTGANVSFGRRVDPISNDFITQAFLSNSWSLSSGVTVYDAGRMKNSIQQNAYQVEAAEYDAAATANDIGLNVASTYLSILLAQEQLENAETRIALSRQQLSQTDKLIEAGALPKNDRLDFVAQIARDEQVIVDAANSVEINTLNLKNLLELDPNYNLRLETPVVEIPDDINPELFNLKDIYNMALSNQPIIRAEEARLKSAEVGVDIAKSGYYPTVSIGASIGTNFSTAAKAPEADPTVVPGEPQPVSINGTPAIIQFPGLDFGDTKTIAYFKQLNENFGGGIGLNVNIPIFNKFNTSTNVERAQLNILNSQLSFSQNKQQLKVSIQRAIADARAARKSLDAAQKSVDAADAAFSNADKRFRLGAINSFEFTTAKNNLDTAQVDLIRAKYQYIFNLKIVDFYQGKALKM